VQPAPQTPPAKLPPPDTQRLPSYSGKEMQAVTRQDPAFEAMIGEVERLLGTILTQSGLEAFVGFYDFLGLPPDVIVMMTGYCVEHMGKPGADGRVRGPGIQALRREAYRWADNDIRDLKAAGEYVKRKEEARALKARYRVLLGLTGRAPSQTEERCLTEWSEAGYPEELLQEAYDRTTQKTGRLVWKYMDTILKSWEKQGLKTLEAVQAGDRHPRRQETAEGEGAAPGDYERMKKYLDSLKES
jgi:DnaD/phage-associated family protein